MYNKLYTKKRGISKAPDLSLKERGDRRKKEVVGNVGVLLGWGGWVGGLCVGSVSVLLSQTKADHTGRQTFGWAECLSLSSQ